MSLKRKLIAGLVVLAVAVVCSGALTALSRYLASPLTEATSC